MYKKDILTMNKIIKLIFVLCCFCGIAQAQPQRPKLVVGIVIDQMRWDYLYRYYARYGEGGFKRMLGEGFSVENCKIPYIPSVTAIGHSSIWTGSVPSIHGIAGNNFVKDGKVVYCTADDTVNPVGSDSKAGKMSPRNLWVTTIGDELRLATNNRSKVIGVALKDRASILPAGHHANGAYWFDDKSGKFITSTFYMEKLPEWVNKFNKQKLPNKYLSKKWETLYPIDSYKESTSDDNNYENGIVEGEKAVLPLDLPALYKKHGYKILRSTPFGCNLTFDIAKAAIEHARKHGNDIVFVDTAGRLHVDEELMEQLKVMKAAIDPDEILLIVDAMIGQDAVNAAQTFDEALDITGVMLTKLDGDARGGAALSIKAVTGKPIKFVGVGEKLDQIEVFHPDRMASRILGMGDVLSLIEKAEQNFDAKKAAELQEKMKKNRLTLTDYYEQLIQLKSMGSLSDIAGMLPGVNAKALEGATVDERLLSQTEAIILSMTPAERENPSLLNSSRKKRIAAGSGTQVVDVNRLLKQFEMMQQMTRQMAGGKLAKKMGRFGGMGKRKGFPFG